MCKKCQKCLSEFDIYLNDKVCQLVQFPLIPFEIDLVRGR